MWSAILQSHFHKGFGFKTTQVLLKTFKSSTRGRLGLLEKTSGLLKYKLEYLPASGCFKYSRGLSNCCTWGLLVKAVKTTRSYPARLQSTRGLVVWTSLGPLPRWVPGPTTWWAPGTTRLVPRGTWWREAQGLWWRSTRIGSYICPALCRGLLDVLD
jgi:hypothetical protein